jgi:hypothetical protein
MRNSFREFIIGFGWGVLDSYDTLSERAETRLADWHEDDRDGFVMGVIVLRFACIGAGAGSVGALALMCLARWVGVLR